MSVKKLLLAELPRAPKAPAGGAFIAIEYGEPIESRKFGYDVMSVRPSVRTYVRTYARTHGLGLGTSLPLSLIWSPSYAKSDTKTYRFYSVRLELSYLS